MGAFEDGQSFLAGVLAKISSPEKRAQVEAVLRDPEAKDAVTLVGDSVLARSDYSRHMDDLKAKETATQAKLDELNVWFEANKAALQEYVVIKPEYDELKAKGGTPPGTPPATPPATPPVDPRKVVEEVLAEEGRGYVNLSAYIAGLSVRHLHMFGEPLDPMELVANPKLGKPILGQPGRVFSLQDAYNEKYGERVAARAKEAEEKRFNDEVQKRLTEERAKLAGQPFPLRNEAPSVLDNMKPAEHTLDTAVAEFERLQQARSQTA